MKKWVAIAGSFAMFLTACGGTTSSGQGGIASTVNIASVAGFTGKYASLGSSWLSGSKLAAYLINQYGGIRGKQVQLDVEDDGYDPVDAVPITRKAIAIDHAVAIIGMTGADYQSALSIIQQSKVLDFNTIGDPSIDHSKMQYVYSVAVSDALSGTAMAVAAHLKSYKNIALIFDTNVGAQGLVPAIKTAAPKLGMNIVTTATPPESALSFEAEIQQVLGSHPDAVLMQLQPVQVGAFFSEWKTAGGTPIPIIFSNNGVTSSVFSQTAGVDEVKNHITAVASLSAITGPGGDTFVKTWQQLYKADYAFYGVYAYDAVTLAALAIYAANSSDPTVYQPFVDDVTLIAADHVTCYTYATCADLLKSGKKIKFSGVGTPLVYNQFHRVASDFGVYTPPLSATAAPTLLTTMAAADINAVT